MSNLNPQPNVRSLYALITGTLLLTLCAATPTNLAAAPVTATDAFAAALGWLDVMTDASLRRTTDIGIQEVIPHYDAQGVLLFYEATMRQSGFMIIAADDAVEPVIAFAEHGRFDPSLTHPLGALVYGDLAGRLAAARRQGASDDTARRSANLKWQQLKAMSRARTSGYRATGVQDLCVSPLVQTRWDQGGFGGVLCYNYWIPDNYPCGCLPTAMAQLMRFHRHPPIAVGTPIFEIQVNGVKQPRALLGGDGQGGPYVWDWMTLVPNANTPVTNRMEIGALCHDAGVAAGTRYANNATATSFTAAVNALRNTFFYSQAVIGYKNANIGEALHAMINPGLDAGLPSMLGIFYGDNAHAALADGYGYYNNTLYHHLNLGWGTSLNVDNAWYALPIVAIPGVTYDVIKICAYNIFAYGTGEIISGRVIDAGGTPIPGVALTIAVSNGPTLTVTSNARGIYAFTGIPSNRDAHIIAGKTRYYFNQQPVRTARSINETLQCGNRWQVNFTGTVSRLPLPADYDGDGKADLVWYDESIGVWAARLTQNADTPLSFTFGGIGWSAAPADYDGDGKVDPAVYHAATGVWRALFSSDNHAETAVSFGGAGWRAVPADYDGDGYADPALYHADTGAWQALLSSANYRLTVAPFTCGGPEWLAVPADYDGDGRADPAAYNPFTGAWQALLSGNNYQRTGIKHIEDVGALPVPADYDGDGKADPATYYAAAGRWAVYRSRYGYNRTLVPLGSIGEFAASADYVGAGYAQIGLYDPSADTWHWQPPY